MTRVIAFILAIICGVLGVVVGSNLQGLDGWMSALAILLISAIAATILYPAMRDVGAKGFDLFAPTVFPGVIFLVIYVLKPLYILNTGSLGVIPALAHQLDQKNLSVMVGALFTVWIGLICYQVGLRTRVVEANVPNWLAVGSSWRVRSVMTASLVLALSAALVLYLKAGGLEELKTALGLRQEFYSGAGATVVMLSAFRLSVLVFLAVDRSPSPAKTALLVLALLPFDLLSGSRSFVLGGVLQVAAIYNYVLRRIPLRLVLVGGLSAILVFGVAYRVILRDVHFRANVGRSATELVTEAVTDLPGYFLGGYDTPQLESLMVVIEETKSSLPYQRGKTLLASGTALVPRSIWEDKPRGAMAEFTQTLFPWYYGTARVEIAISYIGELFWNFGLPGVAAGMFALGLVLGHLYRKIDGGHNRLAVLMYCLVVVKTGNLIRSDSFNSIVQLGPELILVLTFAWLIRSKRRGEATWQLTSYSTAPRTALKAERNSAY